MPYPCHNGTTKGITGHHRATLVEPDNTAELVLVETVQVTKPPESISQAENAGSIPVTRSMRIALRVVDDRAWGFLPKGALLA